MKSLLRLAFAVCTLLGATAGFAADKKICVVAYQDRGSPSRDVVARALAEISAATGSTHFVQDEKTADQVVYVVFNNSKGSYRILQDREAAVAVAAPLRSTALAIRAEPSMNRPRGW